MINLLKFSLFSLAIVMFSYSGAMAATATGNADAEVVAPLAISGGDGGAGGVALDFGIFDNISAGTVLIDPSDDSVTETGINHFGNNSRAEFTVTGKSGQTYSVTLPSTATLNGPSGATMSAGSFTSSDIDTLGSSGDVFYVGATLSVANGQAVGTYSGTYDVIVAYN